MLALDTTLSRVLGSVAHLLGSLRRRVARLPPIVLRRYRLRKYYPCETCCKFYVEAKDVRTTEDALIFRESIISRLVKST
jgi:hypothetical protein